MIPGWNGVRYFMNVVGIMPTNGRIVLDPNYTYFAFLIGGKVNGSLGDIKIKPGRKAEIPTIMMETLQRIGNPQLVARINEEVGRMKRGVGLTSDFTTFSARAQLVIYRETKAWARGKLAYKFAKVTITPQNELIEPGYAPWIAISYPLAALVFNVDFLRRVEDDGYNRTAGVVELPADMKQV